MGNRLWARATSISPLARLLCLEPLELSLLPLNLRLLIGQLPLHVLFAFFSRLHLVADQSSAEQTDGRANSSAGARMSRCGADDPA